MQVETTDIDGHRIRFALLSTTPPVRPLILFNGIGASLELMAPLARAMEEEGISTITFDVPGVGGSATPLLPYRLGRLAALAERLLRQLDIEGPVDALGVSWGGALAQQFAHQYPERCRRLVLAATTAGALMVPGRLSALVKMVNPRRYTDRNFMQKIAGDLYGGRLRHDGALLREYSRHIAPPSGRGYLWQILALAGWTSALWLRRLKQPTLILMGRDDPIVPLINGQILAALIPNSRLLSIDDGHLFLLSRMTEIVPIIRDFLVRDAGEGAEPAADRTLNAHSPNPG